MMMCISLGAAVLIVIGPQLTLAQTTLRVEPPTAGISLSADQVASLNSWGIVGDWTTCAHFCIQQLDTTTGATRLLLFCVLGVLQSCAQTFDSPS